MNTTPCLGGNWGPSLTCHAARLCAVVTYKYSDRLMDIYNHPDGQKGGSDKATAQRNSVEDTGNTISQVDDQEASPE
jgi:hypothetical protein